MTPSALHVDETKSTLNFASRAKSVTNNATVNEIMTDEALLKRQKKEIKELLKQLEASGVTYGEEEVNRIRKEMLDVEERNQSMALQLEEERAQQVIIYALTHSSRTS